MSNLLLMPLFITSTSNFLGLCCGWICDRQWYYFTDVVSSYVIYHSFLENLSLYMLSITDYVFAPITSEGVAYYEQTTLCWGMPDPKNPIETTLLVWEPWSFPHMSLLCPSGVNYTLNCFPINFRGLNSFHTLPNSPWCLLHY